MERFPLAAFTPTMTRIAEFFADLDAPVKFVGGCVRDVLCEIEPKDYDVISPVLPDDMEKFLVSKVGPKKVYTVGKRFGTLGFLLDGEKIEVTTYRGEDYIGRKCFNGCGMLTMKPICPACGIETFATRKPEVTYTENINVDLERRDLTMNAIAIDAFTGKIHDPYNGQEDLAGRVVRAVGNPKVRFKEDPLRILRVVRFAARFNAVVDYDTYDRASKMRWELQRVAKERIITEINAMFVLTPEKLTEALHHMWEMELWQVILPSLQLQCAFNQENPHHKYLLHEHSIQTAVSVRDMYGPDTTRVWAGLLHDIGKPYTKREKEKIPGEYRYHDHDRLGAQEAEKFLNYYRFSNEDTDFIVTTIRDHLKDESWLRRHDNGAKV